MSTTPLGNRRRQSVGNAPETAGRQQRINPAIMPATLHLLHKSAKERSTSVSEIHGIQCIAVSLVGWLTDKPEVDTSAKVCRFWFSDGTAVKPIAVEFSMPEDEDLAEGLALKFSGFVKHDMVRVIGATVCDTELVSRQDEANKKTDNIKMEEQVLKCNANHIWKSDPAHYLYFHSLEVAKAYFVAQGDDMEVDQEEKKMTREDSQTLEAPLDSQEVPQTYEQSDLENLPASYNAIKDRDQRLVVGAILKSRKGETGASLIDIRSALKNVSDEAIKEALNQLLDQDEVFEPLDERYDTVA